ncbi:tetratricopeptide repeat-containing sensor histidine kinase [Flavobacterium aquiphilum]|uniref:tetratricopeptide repeat-containing sensor histidine kinase n=1 Tax=Flavobacterium aquiphilum TaxID=3003261 RepID=UPI002480A5D3|nr:sensor histidine kinase [Flavobacterium aquiphilum]
MKIKYQILWSLIFFLLTISCQKDVDLEDKHAYKKGVVNLLNKIDTLDIKDSDKIIALDTLNRYLLKHENDSVNRNLLFKTANKYYFLGELEKYKKASKKALELSNLKKDSSHIAKSLCYIGNYYYDKSRYDSSFSYYVKSEKLYVALKDSLMLGTMALLKSSVLFENGNYAETETEAIKALRFFSKINRNDLKYHCYFQLACALKGLENYKKALSYYDLALNRLDVLEKAKYDKNKILISRLTCINNIGRIYEKMEDFPVAIQFYKKGLQTQNLKNELPRYYVMLHDNLCYSKMKMGDYRDVYKILTESLKVSDSIDAKSISASLKNNIGRYYLYKKDTVRALSTIKEGLALSKKIKYSELTLESLKLLMSNDSKDKNYFTNEYLRISDSLQKVERETRDKFARIAYETDLVEEENHTLSKQNAGIIVVASLILLFSFGFLIIYRLKTRNKELFLIKEQQEANEKIYQLLLKQQSETERVRNEERNRIAMELHDGVINSVFATRFNLMQLDSNEKERKELLIKELEKAEIEIRRVSHDLSKNSLFEDKSFTEMLTDLLKSQQNQSNTKFDLSLDKFIEWPLVSSANKMHIYRIIQEAIQNCNKYSKAKRCLIIILKTENKITIRIWDNGVGFNTEKARRGIGLRNMKERTNALNGELKITSEIGKGTTIEVVF